MTPGPPSASLVSRNQNLGRVLTAVVMLFGLLMTGVATWRVHAQHQEATRLDFESRASAITQRVRDVLGNHLDALYGMRVLIDHSEELRPDEFSAAAQDFMQRYPGVAALEWVLRVPAQRRSEFEQGMARQGYPDFRITREVPGAPQHFEPAPEQADYYPVTFIEPLAPNRPALGFDVSTAPSWPLRLQSARAGEVGGGQPLRLYRARAASSDQGWILHLPVYRAGPMTEADPAARVAALRGFVLGVFQLSELFATIAPDQARADLDLLVIDETDPAQPHRILFLPAQPGAVAAGQAEVGAAEVAASPFATRRTLEIGGRVWTLWLRPTAAWVEAQRSWTAIIGFVLGGTVTMLFAGLISELRRRNAVVQQEVAERTAELRASREELAGILENSPNIIFVKDLAGRYISVNRRYCEIYGAPRDAILGRTDAELFSAEDANRFQAMDQQVSDQGTTVLFEDTVLTDDGEITSIVHKFPVYDGEGRVRGVCGIATDITQRKRLELEQRTIERKLLEAQKLESLGVLAGGIAHDFNNLLTGVIGNASLAELEVSPDSPVHPLIRDILLAATRASELCRQMLDYSGRGAFVAGPVDPNVLVRDTMPLLRHSLNKSAELQLSLMPNPPTLVADGTQLRQILMNLVINAAEALGNQAGVVRISTGWQLSLQVPRATLVITPEQPAAAYVRLSVADTGSGMSPETLARILDPFFTTKFAGRGLGLAAVSGIVRGHAGALLVDSAVGRGTTFHLLLPVPDEFVGLANGAAAENVLPDLRGEGTVLVIDDEPSVRNVARRSLERFGFTVEVAENGRRGLDLYQARQTDYAFVLLDLTMPGLSGEVVWAQLRAAQPRLPVVLMSGFSEQQFAARWGEDGPAGFIQKPFSVESLQRVLRQILPAATV